MNCASPASRSLPSLIGLAFDSLASELMGQLHARGYTDLQLHHFMNVLRFVSVEGVRPAHIARQAGITQQAVSQAVADLEARGYLVRHPDPDDRRAQVVTWGPKGGAAALDIEAWFRELEESWRAMVGEDAVNGACTTLAAIANRGAR